MKKKVIGILVAVLFVVSALLVACTGYGLTAPTVTLDGDTVNWGAVDNATKYIVTVNGQQYETDKTSYKLTVTEPGNYVITVSAVNGDETKTSDEVTYKVTGTLSAPVITLSGNRVSWNAVSGATAYEVYVNDTLTATVTATNYSMSLDLDEGNYVVTVKAKGNEFYADSVKSNSVTFVVEPAAPVAQPLGKATIAIEGRTVSWTAVENATAYDVYVNGVKFTTVTETEFVFAGRSEGTHSITVKATAAGSSLYTEGEASNAVEYTVAALDMSKPVVAYIAGTKTMAIFNANAQIKQDISLTWDELSADDDYVEYAWRLEKQGETDWYKIKVSNGAYLTATTGANKAYYAAAEDTDNQLWSFTATNGGFFIRNKAYGGELLCAGDVGSDVIHFYSLADNVSYQTWVLFNVDVEFGEDIQMLAAPQIELTNNVVSWTAVEDATGYEVYVNGKLADTVTELNYTIQADEDGYFAVTVKAVGENCLPSLASNQVQYMYSSLDLTKPILATYDIEEQHYVAAIGSHGYLELKLLSEIDESDMYKYIWYLETDGDTGLYKIKLYNGKYATYTESSFGSLEISANDVASGASQQWHLELNGLNQYKLYNKAHSNKWSGGNWQYYFSADGQKNLKFTDNGPENWTFAQSDIEFVEKTVLATPQVTLTETTVTWQAVEHAVSYNVIVNGEIVANVNADETLSYTIDASEKGLYKVVIVAVAETDSFYLDSQGSAEVSYDNRSLFDNPVVVYYNVDGGAKNKVLNVSDDGTLVFGNTYDTIEDVTEIMWTIEQVEFNGAKYYMIKLANGKYLSYYDNPNPGHVAGTIAADKDVTDAKQMWILVEDGNSGTSFKIENLHLSGSFSNVYLGEYWGAAKFDGVCGSWTFAPVEE